MSDLYFYTCMFESPLSKKKLDDLKGENEDCELLYTANTGNENVYVLGCESRLGYKHKDIISKFISTVMSVNSHALAEFEDENYDRSGYLIFHTNPFDAANNRYNIYETKYQPTVDNKSISEFAAQYLKKLQPKQRGGRKCSGSSQKKKARNAGKST